MRRNRPLAPDVLTMMYDDETIEFDVVEIAEKYGYTEVAD